MSVTDGIGIGQTPCSFEHYLVFITVISAPFWRHFCSSDLSGSTAVDLAVVDIT